MQVEIHGSPRDPKAFDLWVNGVVRVRDESYAVVSQVYDALMGRGNPVSECADVARNIAKSLKEGGPGG